MSVENPMTYENAKDELQALSRNIKLELSQYTEKHLSPEDAQAQRDFVIWPP